MNWSFFNDDGGTPSPIFEGLLGREGGCDPKHSAIPPEGGPYDVRGAIGRERDEGCGREDG